MANPNHVGILGKGTSALLTGLVLLRKKHTVSWISDPDTPILDVGESVTPLVANLIYATLNKSVQQMAVDGVVSLKAGAKFVNWGKGKTFHHSLGSQIKPMGENPLCNNVAFNLETTKFNEYIVNEIKKQYDETQAHFWDYKIHDGSIHYTKDGKSIGIGDDPKQRYKDFQWCGMIIDCRGWHDINEGDYTTSRIDSVNTAILYQENSVDIDFDYTLHTATEDGWEFGLPFPKGESGPFTKKGYLFDRNISDIDSIKTKIESKDNVTNVRVKQWIPRFANKLIQNKFMAYNGNRLFFIDPLEALSLHYYVHFAEYISEWVNLRDDRSPEDAANINNQYYTDIMSYQDLLSFHYKYGSIYNTPFWEKVVTSAKEQLSTIANGVDELFLHNLNLDIKSKQTDWSTIGAYESSDMMQIHCGMESITPNELIENNLPAMNKYQWRLNQIS